ARPGAPLRFTPYSSYFTPKTKVTVVPSFRVMTPWYFEPDTIVGVEFFVLTLKIHCCPLESQRKAVSGVVETTVSSTAVAAPLIPTIVKLATTPVVPIETPFASQTRNLVGIVLPSLNTLDPSA